MKRHEYMAKVDRELFEKAKKAKLPFKWLPPELQDLIRDAREAGDTIIMNNSGADWTPVMSPAHPACLQRGSVYRIREDVEWIDKWVVEWLDEESHRHDNKVLVFSEWREACECQIKYDVYGIGTLILPDWHPAVLSPEFKVQPGEPVYFETVPKHDGVFFGMLFEGAAGANEWRLTPQWIDQSGLLSCNCREGRSVAKPIKARFLKPKEGGDEPED